jgi:SAM-dependent methyltransferase
MEKEDNWAKIYDRIYSGYKEDIKFYIDESKKVKGRVLEVGCGTGRIYLELLRRGIDCYGIDISKAMIEKLKSKKDNFNPKVKVADMKSFRYNKKFELIIIPFRTFLMNLTQKDQIKTLRNCYAHLKTGGKLILNFHSPDHSLLSQTLDLKKTSGNGTYFIDRINQVIRMIYKEGKEVFTFDMTFIGKKEFELLLKLSGFKKWNVYGGFKKELLKNTSQEMVWVIKK